jgi:cytochrome c
MPDTMTMTKIVGGFCGTFLVFLLGNWAAEGIYNIGPGEGAEGPRQQAYTIAVAETGAAEEAAAPEENFDEVYANADVASGEKIFGKCKACHRVDNKNATGPHLNGVVGRDIASVEGFGYSDVLKGMEGSWDPDKIQQFIHNPKQYAPGTKMTFPGLPKIQDRADVIAYLATQK